MAQNLTNDDLGGALTPVGLKKTAKTFRRLVDELEQENHVLVISRTRISELKHSVYFKFWCKESDTKEEIKEALPDVVRLVTLTEESTHKGDFAILLKVRKAYLEEFVEAYESDVQ